MPGSKEPSDLSPRVGPPEGAVGINDRCLVRTQDGHRLVMVSGIVLAQFAVGDRMAEAHAMVSLVEQGWVLLKPWALSDASRFRAPSTGSHRPVPMETKGTSR